MKIVEQSENESWESARADGFGRDQTLPYAHVSQNGMGTVTATTSACMQLRTPVGWERNNREPDHSSARETGQGPRNDEQ